MNASLLRRRGQRLDVSLLTIMRCLGLELDLDKMDELVWTGVMFWVGMELWRLHSCLDA